MRNAIPSPGHIARYFIADLPQHVEIDHKNENNPFSPKSKRKNKLTTLRHTARSEIDTLSHHFRPEQTLLPLQQLKWVCSQPYETRVLGERFSFFFSFSSGWISDTPNAFISC